jgi:hypothetical protein
MRARGTIECVQASLNTMNRWNLSRTAALGMMLVLAACAAPAGPRTDQTSADPSLSASPRPLPIATPPSSEAGEPMPSGLTGAVPEATLAEILADAAERAGVPADQLEIVTAAAVTFNDGSLGCPEPGMLYTQALVDGYHVVVRGPERDFDYRAAQRGGFRLCENPGGAGASSTE